MTPAPTALPTAPAFEPAAVPVQSAPITSPATPPPLPVTSASPGTLAKAAGVPPAPGPDEVAWSLLKETTDKAALKRFTAQFPDSPLRAQVETRITALEAAQAAMPVPPSLDEVTWALLKETTDEAALKRFIAQYPSSVLRGDAEARIATLEAHAAKPQPTPAVDPHELVRSLQLELKRVGCFNGAVNASSTMQQRRRGKALPRSRPSTCLTR